MTTEVDTASGAAVEVPAPDLQQETPEVAAPEVEQQPEQKDPIKALEERLEAERQKFERRLHRKHAEAAQAKEHARQLEQQLERHQPKEPAETPEVDVDALAAQKAEQITEQRELARKVQATLAKGKALEGFDAAVNSAVEELGLVNAKGQPTALLHVFLEADAPHEVLYHIGKNPEVASEFDGLTPTQAARRLVKLEAAIAQAKAPKTSAAPAPLKPVTGHAKNDDYSPNMSDKEFDAWFSRQRAKRRAG